MSKPKVYPSAQEIWAAVFAAAFVAEARESAVTLGQGWGEWCTGESERAVGAAGDAATLADAAVVALKKELEGG